MKPRRHISHVSATRAKQMRTYRRDVRKFLRSNERCFACLEYVEEDSRQNHHFYGRVKSLLSWNPGWRMVCRKCHYLIHHNPGWARDHNFICPRGMWNDLKRAQAHHASTLKQYDGDGDHY